MAGVNQYGSAFSGRIEVHRGNNIQIGNINAGGSVNIGRRIYSEIRSELIVTSKVNGGAMAGKLSR